MITFFSFKRSGRNNSGRITVRHRGSGNRFYAPNFAYRLSSYPRVNTPGYKLKQFAFSFQQLDAFISADASNSKPGYLVYFNKFNSKDSARPIFEYSIGQFLYDIELSSGSGPRLCRSFGSFCQVLRKRGTYATLRLPSGEIRKVSVFCFAKLWSSNFPYSRPSFFIPNPFKAGYSRILGIRPHVRGCAMNPVDHPHGGRTGDSRPSVSPWAKLTKGFRTRFKPVNKKLILLSVQMMKDKDRRKNTN